MRFETISSCFPLDRYVSETTFLHLSAIDSYMNKEADYGLASAHQFRSCDICGSRLLFPGANAMVDMASETNIEIIL